jgi:predicted ester cyclase
MRNLKTTLSYQWFEEVWNKNNAAAIDELMWHDVKAYGLSGENGFIEGDGFKSFYHDFTSQYIDIHVEVQDVVSQDDIESARCWVTLTHKESGKKAAFAGICMAKFKEGKMVEAWNCFDFLGMYGQLGLG